MLTALKHLRSPINPRCFIVGLLGYILLGQDTDLESSVKNGWAIPRPMAEMASLFCASSEA